ncbi:1,4-alpha-glucan-branching enzyme [Ciona intestinalis]
MECSSYNNQVMQQCRVPAIENLFRSYPQLRMYEDDIRARCVIYNKSCYMSFSNKNGLTDNWNLVQYREIGFGKWELFIPPNRDGSCAIRHCSELKVQRSRMRTHIYWNDNRIERISPWANIFLDGLNMFDGTEACFFEEGARGFNNEHDTRIFDYKKWETLRFLMSQLRYYVNEYHVDGFRFNGISSMIFNDPSKYGMYGSAQSQYFGMQMKTDGLAYIMLMNDMLHNFYPNVITITEDVPNMPALCRPVSEGGLGFDYRLSKDAANVWAKLFNDTRDEDWNMHFIRQIIRENRVEEKRIMFTELHEQNEVGRMTMSRKLIGDSSMSESQQLTPCLDRGLSLYKMTRLFTHAFAGQGFLNFIGNEFGHPDWVELPSRSNNDSYQLARRQFHLADNQQFRYKFLNRFDRAMNKTEERYGWLKSNQAIVTRAQESDKVFVFERAGLIFAFNFHPTKSYPDYRIPVERFGSYKIVLDTDDRCFGGHSRNQSNVEFHAKTGQYDNFPNSMMVYLPSRSALVLSLSNLAHGSNYVNSGNKVCNSYYGSGQNDSIPGCSRNVRFDLERHSGPSRYNDESRPTFGAYGHDYNSAASGQDFNKRSYRDGYNVSQSHGSNSRQQYW